MILNLQACVFAGIIAIPCGFTGLLLGFAPVDVLFGTIIAFIFGLGVRFIGLLLWAISVECTQSNENDDEISDTWCDLEQQKHRLWI